MEEHGESVRFVWPAEIVPTIEELRAQADGNPDMQLLVTRLEQVSEMGEALALMAASEGTANVSDAEAWLGKCRAELAGAIVVRRPTPSPRFGR